MTIRTRLSLWYAAIMFAALMVMGVLLYNLLVIEPRREARRRWHRERQERVDADVYEDVTGVVMWCGVPSALLALVGGWWLMKKSLAPVTSLTVAAEKISAHNLSERLPRTGSGDELDRLTEVFNGMLARLGDSFQRIREFTLHASHELKTPLTVMRGELETALQDAALASDQRERLLSQLDEVERLAKIVDGLTLLTKADSGQVKLNREPLRLDELVRDAYADAVILAEPSGVKVELGACDEAAVSGDRHRLRQLLLNLADNAVKYNQPGGAVTMALRRAGDAAEITIANTGPGIAPEILPRVFDRFYRADPAHSKDVDGCGLGLSIAQWIVSAHDGTVQIQSEPAKLTTVTVRLPVSTK